MIEKLESLPKEIVGGPRSLGVRQNVKRIIGVCAVVGWCVASPVAEAGQLYKWTDAQGNLHITDVPPPNLKKTPAHEVEPTPHVTTPVPRNKNGPVPPQLPAERKRAEVAPAPHPMVSSQSLKRRGTGVPVPVVGLKPEQATLSSPWEVLDGKRGNAKAGVRRWKDEKGLDHFVDVLPPGNRGGG